MRHRFLTAALISALAAAPGISFADWAAGMAAHHAGDYATAAREFRTAADRSPGYAPAHYMLGLALAGLDSTDEAVAELERAVELAPGETVYLLQLARVELDAGRAEDAWQRLEAVDPDGVDPDLATSTVLLLAKAGLDCDPAHAAEAAAAVEARLEADPESAALFQALGMARLRLGETEPAFRALLRAWQLDPTDAASGRSAASLAQSLAQRSTDADEALRLAERGSEIAVRLAAEQPEPRHAQLAAESLLAMGRMLRARDRGAEAQVHLEQALALGPDQQTGARIHAELARLAEARFDLEAAALHHRLAGSPQRADELDRLTTDVRALTTRRDELKLKIDELHRMAAELAGLNEAEGVEGVRAKAAELEREMSGIEANLAEVRRALQSTGSGADV